LALAAALLFSAQVRPIFAQDQYDPPDRVARLGYLQGAVSFEPAGESEWVGAVPNRPMTTGDQLWTDENARAEVQLGSAVIRLGPNTGFSFLNLDDNTIQIQLTTGSISVTVRRLDDGDDFEVDTPNQAFTAVQPGHYRIDASPDGTYTVLTVRSGYGQSTGAGQTFNVQGGQQVTFSGTDQLSADVEPIQGYDDFDQWSDGRDQRFAQSRSGVYLERDVVGYEDLDQYGDWRDDPQYGHVWYPSQVESGWAPYHVGHWDWISPWGWTWVDDAPWGYAPFHYGRWVSVGGRWGWVAGPTQVRAVYAPALVVFLGGVSGGNVGWFPLGPREVFVPSYHVSQDYVTRVNVANTTVNVTQVTNIYNTTIVRNNVNITNVTYANRNVRGAVMAVPQAAFVSAQPVARAAVTLNARDIATASVTARVAVVPTQASVLGPRAGVRVAAPPAVVAARVVVAKKTPPPPPVPFVRQQQALALHPGQALAPAEMHSLAPPVNTAAARPMVKQAPPGRPATATSGRPLRPAPAQLGVRPAAPAPLQPGGARPAVQAPAAPETYQNNRQVAPAQTQRPAEQPPAQYRPPATEPVRPVTPPAETNRPEPRREEPAPKPQPPVQQERPAPPQPQRPVPQERQAPPPEHQQPQAKPAPEPKDQPKKDDKKKPKDEEKKPE
jgi:hypothetical protein